MPNLITMSNLRHLLASFLQEVSRQNLFLGRRVVAPEDLLLLVEREEWAELTKENVANNNPLCPLDLREKVSVSPWLSLVLACVVI